MSTPTAIAERALTCMVELMDENRQLTEALRKAEDDAAQWRERHGRVFEVDDGSFAHAIGMNSGENDETEILMEFYDADGKCARRKFKECGEW